MKKKEVITIAIILIGSIVLAMSIYEKHRVIYNEKKGNFFSKKSNNENYVILRNCDLSDIDIDTLPQEVYDYNLDNKYSDLERITVRLDCIVNNDLKVYAVGDWNQEKILLVYKDSYYYTDWYTSPGEQLSECMVYDFDDDGDNELAICAHADNQHDNLYIVELAGDKLWQYQMIGYDDESIDKYIWNQLSYKYNEKQNNIIFSSPNGINTIVFNEEAFPADKIWFEKNIKPETLNYRDIILGGHIYHKEDGPYYNLYVNSEAGNPNFTEYNLNLGDLIMDISVDRVQGSNYGDVYIKLKYTEKGIMFEKLDFINNYDVCY